MERGSFLPRRVFCHTFLPSHQTQTKRPATTGRRPSVFLPPRPRGSHATQDRPLPRADETPERRACGDAGTMAGQRKRHRKQSQNASGRLRSGNSPTSSSWKNSVRRSWTRRTKYGRQSAEATCKVAVRAGVTTRKHPARPTRAGTAGSPTDSAGRLYCLASGHLLRDSAKAVSQGGLSQRGFGC